MLFIALLMIIFRILDRYRDREERQAERAEDLAQRQAELKAFQESINKMSQDNRESINKMSQDNLKAFKEYLDRDSRRTGQIGVDETVCREDKTKELLRETDIRIQKNFEYLEKINSDNKWIDKSELQRQLKEKREQIELQKQENLKRLEESKDLHTRTQENIELTKKIGASRSF